MLLALAAVRAATASAAPPGAVSCGNRTLAAGCLNPGLRRRRPALPADGVPGGPAVSGLSRFGVDTIARSISR